MHKKQNFHSKKEKYHLQSYYQENTTFFLHSLATPKKSTRFLVASSYEVKQLFKKGLEVRMTK